MLYAHARYTRIITVIKSSRKIILLTLIAGESKLSLHCLLVAKLCDLLFHSTSEEVGRTLSHRHLLLFKKVKAFHLLSFVFVFFPRQAVKFGVMVLPMWHHQLLP